MTAAGYGPGVDVPVFKITGTRPSIPFMFDGDAEEYVLRRPKLITAISMMQLAEARAGRNSLDVGRDLARLLMQIVNFIERRDPEPAMIGRGANRKPNPRAGELHGRDRLIERLDSSDDELDLIHLEQPFRELVGRLFGNLPTGASPESSPARRTSDSNGSAAGTRSTPRKTSGTSTRKRSSSRSAKTGSSTATKGKPRPATR